MVVVHGVAPHPRYQFQDQCSGDLAQHLNEKLSDGGSDSWVVDVVNPVGCLPPDADDPQPTISRVHRANDRAHAPQREFIDIMEAYWSPIDKGRTNWFFVLRWIFRSVFTPLNTTARYVATWQKQFFDYGYIGGALVIAFALFGISLGFVWESFSAILSVTGLISRTTPAGFISTLNTPVAADVLGHFPVKIIAWLFVGVIGAYLVTQAMKAIVTTIQQRTALRNAPGAILHRVIAIAFLSVVGSLLVYSMAVARFPEGTLGWRGVLFLLIIFVAFELGRAILLGFLVGFFGDVQIYCTRDENSTFFDYRERIIDVAVEAMRRAISPAANGGQVYDAVIILAHSLGATVAMDALMRLYQLREQGAIKTEDFERIRVLLTLGSSLEKTKYFFDVTSASQSAAHIQWNNDVYGALFTADPAVLELPNDRGTGILWGNYWYFQDPICNEIASYGGLRRSDKAICRNEQGHRTMTLFHPMLHGDYLDDEWFWHSRVGANGDLLHLGALDVIASVMNKEHTPC